ncbi:GTP-binding protein [Pseudomonas sp. Ost2]|uniref:YdgA family protein n=1 Tax=Pseudomonas TaxID=286 RepID=UPI0015A4EC03|nr:MULTISPECIES: YdgA family protein [Pseudomonas]NWA06929.1 YdgA family protein [Pseudomonas gingeri]NWE49601.1 YdgA family protein [Pseudomonas gingeri]NWE73120.1 YdgA family protein [Pseudomonas gingeri]BBP74052.1 GTP-binding protein [Pseudomonas sp. Ost2]
MNKSAGVLLGFVVVVGAVSTAGAWYTGNQLEGVLNTSIQEANAQLKTALSSGGGNASIELVSLDRNLFTSTAHYRLKLQNLQLGEDNKDVDLLFVDHIEHGPLPLSRLKALKLTPVMVNSNYELEKNDVTAKWFDAAKGAAPLKGVVALGYNNSIDGNVELIPLDFAPDDKSSVKFSGLNLNLTGSDRGAKIKLNGYMDSLKIAAQSAEDGPVSVELGGLTLVSDLAKSDFGFYLGGNTLELSNAKVTYGLTPATVTVKDFEQKDSLDATGNILAGRLAYTVGDIGYNGKSVGSAQMSLAAKNLDIPAVRSLTQIYQSELQAMQQAAAQGEETPAVPELTAEQQLKAQADIRQLLAGKPQIAVENLSFKTANGESRFSLLLDLTNPSSTQLPPLELGKQLIAQLDAKLSLSKPMIADLAGVQAQVEGQTDPKAIAQYASMSSEMAGTMAVSTEMATIEGTDIVSKLHYAAGQVDFNGQKMPVEDFIALMMSKVGGLSGAEAAE